MIKKVDKSEFSELKQKFSKYVTKFPTVNAVISNIQEGLVYSDKSRDNLFITAKFGWSILINKCIEDVGLWFEFLKTNRDIPDYIHLLPPNEQITKYIQANWPKFKVRERCQLQIFNDLSLSMVVPSLPSEMYFKKIQDIEFSKLRKFEFDFANRYWNSEDDFIQNAVGACILDGNNEPIAICYSICVVDSIAELEIFVLPEYQGKGIGKIVAEYYINLCNEKGLTAHWDSFTANTPSFQLAKKLGFKEINKYNMVSTFLRDW